MQLGATLYVRNSVEAVAFYREAFDLELGYHEMYPDGSFLHAALCKDGKEIFAVSEASDQGIAEAMRAASWPTMSYGIDLNSEEKTRRVYALLAEGGHVLRPLGPLPWNPCCADVVDKYGVYWYIYTVETRKED
jgi:uncharacterized glyoxalase superfamily protein PhnB